MFGILSGECAGLGWLAECLLPPIRICRVRCWLQGEQQILAAMKTSFAFFQVTKSPDSIDALRKEYLVMGGLFRCWFAQLAREPHEDQDQEECLRRERVAMWRKCSVERLRSWSRLLRKRKEGERTGSWSSDTSTASLAWPPPTLTPARAKRCSRDLWTTPILTPSSSPPANFAPWKPIRTDVRRMDRKTRIIYQNVCTNKGRHFGRQLIWKEDCFNVQIVTLKYIVILIQGVFFNWYPP